jgi:hypothetical protein
MNVMKHTINVWFDPKLNAVSSEDRKKLASLLGRQLFNHYIIKANLSTSALEPNP